MLILFLWMLSCLMGVGIFMLKKQKPLQEFLGEFEVKFPKAFKALNFYMGGLNFIQMSSLMSVFLMLSFLIFYGSFKSLGLYIALFLLIMVLVLVYILVEIMSLGFKNTNQDHYLGLGFLNKILKDLMLILILMQLVFNVMPGTYVWVKGLNMLVLYKMSLMVFVLQMLMVSGASYLKMKESQKSFLEILKNVVVFIFVMTSFMGMLGVLGVVGYFMWDTVAPWAYENTLDLVKDLLSKFKGFVFSVSMNTVFTLDEVKKSMNGFFSKQHFCHTLITAVLLYLGSELGIMNLVIAVLAMLMTLL